MFSCPLCGSSAGSTKISGSGNVSSRRVVFPADFVKIPEPYTFWIPATIRAMSSRSIPEFTTAGAACVSCPVRTAGKTTTAVWRNFPAGSSVSAVRFPGAMNCLCRGEQQPVYGWVRMSTEGGSPQSRTTTKKKHSRGCYSTEFFAKLFSKKASIKHAQRGVRDSSLSLQSFLSRERKRRGAGHFVSLPSNSPPSRAFP